MSRQPLFLQFMLTSIAPDCSSILVGTVALFTFTIIAIGPEKHGLHFEDHVLAFEQGGGRDDAYVQDHNSPVAGGSRVQGRKYPGSDEKMASEEERLEIS